MSLIASTSQQICRSPVNNSKAKMLYSFPKSPRFPRNKQNECDQFYQVSKKSIIRTTSLGFGNKYDFTKDSPKTPPPGAYENQNIFEVSKRQNKGFGFGSGRGEMEATGLIKKNQNPGPGTYESQSQKSKMYCTLKGKGKVDNREQVYVPGPGTYETVSSFNKSGHSFFSKFKNKSAGKFNKDIKLKSQKNNVPGPGTYQTKKVEFSPEGKYFFSRLQSAKSSKFGKSSKLSITSRYQTPGPGNYRLPSQFGYYINKSALDDIKNQLKQL